MIEITFVKMTKRKSNIMFSKIKNFHDFIITSYTEWNLIEGNILSL